MLQALEYGAKLAHEDLHFQELGIATLCALFVNANRGKDSAPAKPGDFHHFKSQADRVQIDATASEMFFKLVSEERLPSWVVAIAPIEELKASRSNRKVSQPVVWIGEDVVLLSPKLQDNRVFAPLAIVQGEGKVTVKDETGQVLTLTLPPGSGDRWIIDAEMMFAA